MSGMRPPRLAQMQAVVEEGGTWEAISRVVWRMARVADADEVFRSAPRSATEEVMLACADAFGLASLWTNPRHDHLIDRALLNLVWLLRENLDVDDAVARVFDSPGCAFLHYWNAREGHTEAAIPPKNLGFVNPANRSAARDC